MIVHNTYIDHELRMGPKYWREGQVYASYCTPTMKRGFRGGGAHIIFVNSCAPANTPFFTFIIFKAKHWKLFECLNGRLNI